MRYQRLRYRYTMVIQSEPGVSLAGGWRVGSASLVLGPPRWRPEADVYETPTAIVVIAELAGVDEETLDVLLYEDALVVDGQRTIPACESGGVYHAVGIRQGPFRLEVRLRRAIDAAKIEAQYARGLLSIRLPTLTEGDENG